MKNAPEVSGAFCRGRQPVRACRPSGGRWHRPRPAVGRVGLGAVRYVLLHDVLGHTGDVARRVLEQALLRIGREQAEQVAGLGEVVGIVLAVVPAVGRAVEGQRRLGEGRLLLPLALGVGLVGDGAAVVAVHAHGAVAVVGVVGAARRVHGDLVVVHAQAVARGIAVREQARLQHAVGRGPMPGTRLAGVNEACSTSAW